MLTGHARDRVRRLRAVGARGDSLATRRSMERALAGAELTPDGLPPGAIVCVRRLRSQRARRDPGGWALGLKRQVAGILVSAVRPFREGVPADGNAVIFRDEAELLACLARDWRAGAVMTWWWNGLFGQPVSGELVRHVFLENPRFVPAAVGILAEGGHAAEIIRALPDTVCSELERAVEIAFGVPAVSLPGVAAFSSRPTADGRSQTDRAADGTSRRIPRPAGHAVAFAALPGDLSRLSPVQRSFLATALLMCHAPALARSPGVLQALQDSIRTGPFEPATERHRVAARIDSSRPPQIEHVLPEESPAHGSMPAETRPSADARVSDACARELAGAERDQTTPPVSESQSAAHDHPVASTFPEPVSEPLPTAFAGIFYLVNLLTGLGVYADFTQPARAKPEVPLGRFLARVAERLCGDVVRQDSLWPALCRLADDRDELPSPDASSQTDRLIDDVGADLERVAARALDMEEGTALEFLCSRPGRVLVGRTRIDVFFALAEHPIAIRLAGIDRNPGWVPAAGRVITFHYDEESA